MAKLIPVFSLSLNHKIACRLFTVGKYSDKNPNITGATLGDKVILKMITFSNFIKFIILWIYLLTSLP